MCVCVYACGHVGVGVGVCMCVCGCGCVHVCLHVVISCFPFTYSIPKGILHTPVDDGRFRRDPRALDEDEELWFEGEDELENIDPSNSLVPPLTPPISLSGKNKLVLECELKPELSPGLDSSPPSSHVGTPRPTRADMELFKPLSKSSSPPPPTLKPVSHLHIQSNLGKRKFRGPTTLVLIIRSSSYQDILPNQTGS